jgi:hypothetical protein
LGTGELVEPPAIVLIAGRQMHEGIVSGMEIMYNETP